MGRGKSYLEENLEERERTACECRSEERGRRDAGTLDWKRRGDGAGGAGLADRRRGGEAGGNGAKQVLLQHQGADARGAGAAQAIGREADGGAEGDRGNGEGLRISIQPGGHFTCRAGGLGGRGEQVLPVF